MNAPTLDITQLSALRPCKDRLEVIAEILGDHALTAAEARAAGATFNDIIWVACAVARQSADVERRLHLCLADYVARVLHPYKATEATEASAAPREAIIAARRFARGEIDAAAISVASAAARFAAISAACAEISAASAAEEVLQFDRLCAWLSDHEPEDWPLPAPPVERIAS